MDAFGYNALSGFFGSSNMKSARQEQIAYLERIYNLQQQQTLNEQKAAEASQKYIDDSYSAAVELTTGKNARRKDLIDVQQMSADLLAPINEKIRQAGGYTNALRLGINQDLKNYQYQLLNNDKVFQMKKNQNAIAKIIQMSGDEKQKHLIPLRDLESFEKWKNEVSDEVTFGRPDSEIDLSFIDSYTGEQEINIGEVIRNNKHTLAKDFSYHVGGNDEDLQNQFYALALNEPGDPSFQKYVQDRLGLTPGYDPNIKFGRAAVKTSLGQELLNGQMLQFSKDGYSQSEIIQAGGFDAFVKKMGKDTFFDTVFTLDENNTNLMSKASITGDFAGEIAAYDKDLQLRIIDAAFGNDFGDNQTDGYYINDDGEVMIRMYPQLVNKLYEYKGSSLDGEATYMDRTADDMKVKGIYLGMKAFYIDRDTGETKTKILTKDVKDINPLNRAEYINKVMKSVAAKEGSVKFKQAYIMQLEEPDILGFGKYTDSDIYYYDIDIMNPKFTQRIKDEEYDKAISEGRDQRARTSARIETERDKSELKLKVNESLNNIYTKDNPYQIENLMNTFEVPAMGVMRTNNIDFKMLPYFFADVFDLSQQLTSENTGQNVQTILQNFSNLATENPELYKIYQSGKPTALTEYYKAVYKDNPKLYEQKLSRFKLWSKYFN